MPCCELNITDFFCFVETEKIFDHEVTDLCFPQETEQALIKNSYMGRRVRKKVYTGSTGNWTLSSDYCFVYDNYLQIEKIDMMNNAAIVAKRIWFNGKLVCDINSISGTDIPYYAMGDANKNITEYFDANGNIVAHYEYSPFGKITKTSGSLANDFEFRFSSEVYDKETGLVYYNYRYYSPELGRWLSRDPIGEKGGLNLYAMVGNGEVNQWDKLGLVNIYGFKIELTKLKKGCVTIYKPVLEDTFCSGGTSEFSQEITIKVTVTPLEVGISGSITTTVKDTVVVGKCQKVIYEVGVKACYSIGGGLSIMIKKRNRVVDAKDECECCDE